MSPCSTAARTQAFLQHYINSSFFKNRRSKFRIFNKRSEKSQWQLCIKDIEYTYDYDYDDYNEIDDETETEKPTIFPGVFGDSLNLDDFKLSDIKNVEYEYDYDEDYNEIDEIDQETKIATKAKPPQEYTYKIISHPPQNKQPSPVSRPSGTYSKIKTFTSFNPTQLKFMGIEPSQKHQHPDTKYQSSFPHRYTQQPRQRER